MASIRAVIRKKKNAAGQYPIAIRITKNRKSSFLHTGQYIEEKYWNSKNQCVKKGHSNSAWLNNFIVSKLAEANEKLLELESSKEAATAQKVTQQVKFAYQATTFFELAKIYLAHLEANEKFNRLNAEKPKVKHFRKFLRGKDIAFHEITEVLLKKFQSYLRTTTEVSERTIVNNLVVIRTIFNLAIREGIADQKYYPFGKGGIVIKFPESMKIGLTMEEVKKIENVNLVGFPQEHHARNIWLFSFYFAGMRISDVLKLKWSDFKDGRLYYRMAKNKKTLSLKMPEKALAILKEYRDDKDSSSDYVFPELKKAIPDSQEDILRKIATNTKIINKYLARVAKKIELEKPLKTHIARHTFGTISGDKISLQKLQQLYRHSDITTTIDYQKAFIHKDANDALDAVLNS